MLKGFAGFCMFLMLLSVSAFADVNVHKSEAVITFKVKQNNSKSRDFFAELEINKLPQSTKQSSWQIAFNLMRTILQSSPNVNLVEEKSVGDFHVIGFHLPANSRYVKFTIRGKGIIQTYTDAPQAYFLIELNGKKEEAKEKIYSIKKVETVLLKTAKSKILIRQGEKSKQSDIELSADDSRIVPLPAKIERKKNQQDFILSNNTSIIVGEGSSSLLQTTARRFQSALQEAIGYSFPIQTSLASTSNSRILFTTKQALTALNKKQDSEGYVIDVTSNQILISALSERGFFYALQSLKQLFPPEIYASNKAKRKIEWHVPSFYIIDYPRFAYRGLHLDSARHFFTPLQVKRLLDLMANHKLNYFHWHLTDDEAWRLEIKKYPELTKVGAYRGYQPGISVRNYLPPAYGSGPQSYGGYYTQEQVRDIVNYANARFITIIPEIDLPGHARAMIISLGDQLGEKYHGNYKSVQGYSDNVLSICEPKIYAVIDDILEEVVKLFPGQYIHIGGDEVPSGVWQHSIACKKLHFDARDPYFTNKVQNYFLQRMQKIITSHGKIMAGWEEIAANKITLSPPLLVYIWNHEKIEQVYKKAAREHYEIVMSPAKNLYFDLAYSEQQNEPGQYWAGYVDTFSAYSLKPISQQQSTQIIQGVQAQLWSEEINSSERLDYFAFPRIAGLAELAWTPEYRRNWKNFSERMKMFHLKRLDNYGVRYRKDEF